MASLSSNKSTEKEKKIFMKSFAPPSTRQNREHNLIPFLSATSNGILLDAFGREEVKWKLSFDFAVLTRYWKLLIRLCIKWNESFYKWHFKLKKFFILFKTLVIEINEVLMRSREVIRNLDQIYLKKIIHFLILVFFVLFQTWAIARTTYIPFFVRNFFN